MNERHLRFARDLADLAGRNPDDEVVTALHELVQGHTDGRRALVDLIEDCHDVDHPSVEHFSDDTVVVGGTVEVDLQTMDSPGRDAWQLVAAHVDSAIVHSADRDDLLRLVDADFIAQIDRAIARAANADRDVQIELALRVVELFSDADDTFDSAPDDRRRVACLVDAGLRDPAAIDALLDRWEALPPLAREAADELARDWDGPAGGFLDVIEDSLP